MAKIHDIHMTRMPEELRGPCDECCCVISAAARNISGYPAEVVEVTPDGSRSLCGIHAGLRRCDECWTRSLRNAGPCDLCAESAR